MSLKSRLNTTVSQAYAPHCLLRRCATQRWGRRKSGLHLSIHRLLSIRLRPSCAVAGMQAGHRLGFRLTLPDSADPNSPLVVVLGWYGAQDRHVAKYSQLLGERGFPSVRGVLPGAAVFSPLAWPRRRFAAALLDFLAAVDPHGRRPIVFFAFSNGGAFVLEQVDSLLHKDPRHATLASRVAGCIFDSAPCYMHLWTGATAIGHGRSLPLRVLAAAVFLVTTLVGMLASPFWPQRFWRSMRDLRLGPRTLFLYSADDPLCDPVRLEQLIASRRQLSGSSAADVAAVRWERSQHVAHLLKHYKEYTAALFGFLEGVQRY